MKKSIKALLFILIAIFTFTFISSNKVSADMGPHSSIRIEIVGNTNNLYMTLLSKSKNSGPWSIDNDINDDIDLKFKEFKDDFYYLGLNKEITNKVFEWSYMPPSPFKVLIYDKTNDKFITDGKIYESYAFYSEFKLNLNNDSFTLEKNKSITSELLNLLLRITLCLIIELIVAIIFKFKKQELLLIALANLITQIILNALLNLVIYYNGFNILLIIPYYIISEIIVLIIETAIYFVFIPKIDNKYNINLKNNTNILGYALLANMISLTLGAIILTFVPGMH